MVFKFRDDFRLALVLVMLSVTIRAGQAKASFLGQPRLSLPKDTPSLYLSPAQARKLEESLDDLAEVSVDEDDVDSILVPRIRGVRQTPAALAEDSVQVPGPEEEQLQEELPHSNLHRQLPNLVKMLSTMNFTNADLLQTNTLRAGFDPILQYNVFQPMWDSSLDSLQKFVDGTAKLAILYNDIQELSVENVSILKNLVQGTNVNYVGYYN